jgi:hypothetical protein
MQPDNPNCHVAIPSFEQEPLCYIQKSRLSYFVIPVACTHSPKTCPSYLVTPVACMQNLNRLSRVVSSGKSAKSTEHGNHYQGSNGLPCKSLPWNLVCEHEVPACRTLMTHVERLFLNFRWCSSLFLLSTQTSKLSSLAGKHGFKPPSCTATDTKSDCIPVSGAQTNCQTKCTFTHTNTHTHVRSRTHTHANTHTHMQTHTERSAHALAQHCKVWRGLH